MPQQQPQTAASNKQLPAVCCPVHTGVPSDQVFFYNQTTNGDPRTGVTAMSVSEGHTAWAGRSQQHSVGVMLPNSSAVSIMKHMSRLACVVQPTQTTAAAAVAVAWTHALVALPTVDHECGLRQ
jgi:hypothetical protein